MKKFDYSFLKNELIPSETVSFLTQIVKRNLINRDIIDKYPKIFNELKLIAIAQSTIASNAIEGIITSDKRVKDLLAGNVSPINHDEREILGYKDVLENIHTNYQHFDISENLILEFHNQLLSYDNSLHRGKYKTSDNVIREISKDDRRSIRFRPTPANETSDTMEQLILAFIEARDDTRINQLLLIPCFILDFLCIHPFADGNGRLSRLLTSLLLYKNNYDIVKFVSFENQINLYKNEYYEALRNSSIKWHEGYNNYYYFINNFLITLIRSYNELDKRFDILSEKKLTKKDRIKNTILKSLVPISRKEIEELWPDIAVDTIKRELINLQNDKVIRKIGSFKNAKYIKL